MPEVHPDSGYGVVPDPNAPGKWAVWEWDGQTGETSDVVTGIQSKQHAIYIRNERARDRRYGDDA